VAPSVAIYKQWEAEASKLDPKFRCTPLYDEAYSDVKSRIRRTLYLS
jgi:hypothetical protein